MPETVSTRIGTYTVITKARGHAILGDEPLAFGGDGLGPSPVELLQAALAHCIIVTMTAEAKALGQDLPSVEVRVSYTLNLRAQGPSDPLQRQMRLTAITVTIIFDTEVSLDLLERLRFAADNCPVGNTLAAGLRLEKIFTTRTALSVD